MKIDQILLYISAAADLRAERETLSRAISEIPVPMGWRIIFSPLHGERVDVKAVQRADLHFLVFGKDIRAPIGFEWLMARRAHRAPVPFLKANILRTPAAEDFIRRIKEEVSWRNFKSLADLRMQALLITANYLFRQAEHYSLSYEENERLKEWRDGLEKSDEKTIDDRRSATGESSVILTTERFSPKEGVLIQLPKKKGDEEK